MQQQVARDRVATLGAMSASLDGHQRPARKLGQPGTSREGVEGILIAVDDKHRAAYAASEFLGSLFVHYERSILVCDQHLWCCLKPPAHHVLDLLGGVRLGEDLGHEEFEKAPVVLEPVVAIVLGPALVGFQEIIERIDHALLMALAKRNTRATKKDAGEEP